MQTSTLGTSGPRVSRIGLGTWAIGGPYQNGWGPTDDAESVAAIHHAASLGVSWIDTAPAYGLGHSERVVGRALADLPHDARPLVFTKCGRRWDPTGSGEVWTDLSPESIALECEASLDRLGLDTLDVLQIHRPGGEGDTPLAEAWGVLANLAEAGKVRWLGLSNVSADQVAECHAIRRVDCVQPPFNVFERSNDVANFCAEQGIGVITYSPLGSGILSGSFSMERHASLADGDWRKRHRRFAPSLLERKLEVATQLSGIATDLGCSLPELAIAWVLHQTGVTASIVGARSPSQIDQWIGAADLTLTSDVINQIDRVASELGRAS